MSWLSRVYKPLWTRFDFPQSLGARERARISISSFDIQISREQVYWCWPYMMDYRRRDYWFEISFIFHSVMREKQSKTLLLYFTRAEAAISLKSRIESICIGIRIMWLYIYSNDRKVVKAVYEVSILLKLSYTKSWETRVGLSFFFPGNLAISTK